MHPRGLGMDGGLSPPGATPAAVLLQQVDQGEGSCMLRVRMGQLWSNGSRDARAGRGAGEGARMLNADATHAAYMGC